jgi:hypothetical protein
MLVVSGQKQKQVSSAIQSGRGILLLGPSGSGKKFCVRQICDQLGIRMQEVDSLEMVARRIIGPVVLFAYESALEEYVQMGSPFWENRNGKIIPVISVSGEYIAVSRIPPSMTVIRFHAFSDIAIDHLVRSSVPISTSEDVIRGIVRRAEGDARKALNEIDVLGIGGACIPRKRKRKNFNDESATIEPTSTQSLSFFHILGKLLYNKRGVSPLQLSAEPIVDDSPVIASIHENAPDFFTDISEYMQFMHTASFADTYMRRKFDSDRHTANYLVFAAVTSSRSTETIPGGFKEFRKCSSVNSASRRGNNGSILLNIRTECNWISDSRIMHFVDFILRESRGSIPENWSDGVKTLVYNFARGGGSTCLTTRPCELPEDPIE